MTPVGWLRFMEDYKASGKVSQPEMAPLCPRCESFAIGTNGFCVECAHEIEQDIALDDAAPPKLMRGKVNYGSVVDPFGKDAA